MRSGKLNRLITIQSKTLTADEYGGSAEAWGTFTTAWAGKYPLSSREMMAAKAAQSETVARFVIRYISGVTSAMRILHDSKIYAITAPPIDYEDAHKELHVMTSEGVTNG